MLSPKFSKSQQIINPEKANLVKENKGISKLTNTNVIGFISGQITECNTGIGISSVAVFAENSLGQFTIETDQTGNYVLTVDTGTYDVSFILLGFQTRFFSSVVVTENTTTTLNSTMCQMPYPVSNVWAEPNEAGTDVYLTWDLPAGPYAIISDDNSAEDYAVFSQSGGAIAVRYTPAGYPATIIGGKLFAGDGSFPPGGSWWGSNIVVGVADDDGPNGLPGTILEEYTISVNNYNWIEFHNIFNATIDDGDFYLYMRQLTNAPDAVPIGIDTDQPLNYRSYAKMPGGDWYFSPYQDYMIRAEVHGPNNGAVSSITTKERKITPDISGLEDYYLATSPPEIREGFVKTDEIVPLENSFSDRSLAQYNIYRIDGFNPDLGEGPEDGTATGIGSSYTNAKNDNQIGSWPPGFYAWAVEVEYDNGDLSVWAYSNIVAHLLDNVSTTSITQCDGGEPSEVEVTLIGHNYPYQILSATSGADGIVIFDSVIDGTYDINIFKVGYQNILTVGELIMDDISLQFVLEENGFPPRNLFVDSLTSVANWDEALIEALPLEDFEDELFPPEGWTQTTYNPHGQWLRVNEVMLTGWTIPPQYEDGTSSWFAYGHVSSTAYGGSTDYLITPMVDLRESDSFVLSFDSFFDGAYGGQAMVFFSTDEGTTWNVLRELIPVAGSWRIINVDLSSLANNNDLSQVWFCFRKENTELWSYGWAIDNVYIHNGPAPIEEYYVYLDDSFVSATPPEIRTFTFEDLMYGTQYMAKVYAKYSCGLSDPEEFIWTSTYLYPANNLQNEYLYNTNEVPLKWNLPIITPDSIIPPGLIGFNIYRDSIFHTYEEYEGQGINDLIYFIDNEVDPGTYTYELGAVYDLTEYGFENETAESMWTEPNTVSVVWGNKIPFLEAWDNASFEFQEWTVENEHWKINTQQGSPLPSAEFKGLPQINEAYLIPLTSNYLNADMLTEGQLFLDFDIKLVDRNSTGQERMIVQIKLAEDTVWSDLMVFENNGSFGFDSHHIFVPDRYKNEVMQIRYLASGVNSYDISSWFIDNIHLYRYCAPPTALSAEYVWNSDDDYGIEICWSTPDIPLPISEWIHWDSGESFGGIGAGTLPWTIAARWDAGMLIDYDGAFITKVRFFPNDDGYNSFTIKIWYGPNASTLIAQQLAVDVITGVWNELVFDVPIEINVNNELWVGYTIDPSNGGIFPAGNDEGPAIVGYGDKVSMDGVIWDNLSDFGLDYNWNVQAYVEELVNEPKVNAAIVETTVNWIGSGATLISSQCEIMAKETEKVNDRHFTGYRIYSKANDDPYYEFLTEIPYVTGQLDYCSWMPAEDMVNTGDCYFYKVTAIYSGEDDYCESDPAINDQGEDFVYACVTNINEEHNESIKLYPNPTSNNLNISAPQKIYGLTIYSLQGKVVYESESIGEGVIQINTTMLDNGVYLVKLETLNEVLVKKITIAR